MLPEANVDLTGLMSDNRQEIPDEQLTLFSVRLNEVLRKSRPLRAVAYVMLWIYFRQQIPLPN